MNFMKDQHFPADGHLLDPICSHSNSSTTLFKHKVQLQQFSRSHSSVFPTKSSNVTKPTERPTDRVYALSNPFLQELEYEIVWHQKPSRSSPASWNHSTHLHTASEDDAWTDDAASHLCGAYLYAGWMRQASIQLSATELAGQILLFKIKCPCRGGSRVE